MILHSTWLTYPDARPDLDTPILIHIDDPLLVRNPTTVHAILVDRQGAEMLILSCTQTAYLKSIPNFYWHYVHTLEPIALS
jgi:hypothetical protein